MHLQQQKAVYKGVMGGAAERRLERILRSAYSGEQAAAFAYRGHSASLRDGEESDQVRRIEDEEWQHRRQVGEMLQRLGRHPERYRELRSSLIGRSLGALCHVMGWFFPMYLAGLLESRNVREYEDAARWAAPAGRPDWIEPLIGMAEVEWDHEAFFRSRIEGHPMTRIFRLWTPLPPKTAIREGLRVYLAGLD